MIFVDTSAFLAIENRKDTHHKQALLITSNCVLAETYTRIRYDDEHLKALQFHSLTTQAINVGRLLLGEGHPTH